MLKSNSILFIVLFSLTIFSCSTSQKIETIKPEPDDASPLLYESSPSFINLPINIKLKDIENQTNTLLKGLIYEDNTIEDDNIELKVWKTAPITIITEKGELTNRIKTVLALKIVAKYRIGTTKMGISLYDIREFNLNGVITLISDVSLSNWKLSTKTELKSLDWNESPSMTVFGKNMPVTYLINPTIQLFKSKIEKNIDAAIEKSMDFKPNVLAAIEKISAPLLLNETYKSWLRILPIEIYSTKAILKNDSFMLAMGMKCNMETIIGQKPETKFDADKIILKPVAKIPEQIRATIAGVMTYQDASKIMTANFMGQEFGSGKNKVKVQNVSIWHKNGKMVLALEVLGSVNGSIYLTGIPKYNEQNNELYFDNLDYVLDTKSKILRTANWLAQGYILKKIEASCHISIQSNLEEGKQNMMRYLKNYSPLTGVFINGKIGNVQFEKIQLTNQAILAFIKVDGNVTISVDGLK